MAHEIDGDECEEIGKHTFEYIEQLETDLTELKKNIQLVLNFRKSEINSSFGYEFGLPGICCSTEDPHGLLDDKETERRISAKRITEILFRKEGAE